MALPTVDHVTTPESAEAASSLTFSFTVNGGSNAALVCNVHFFHASVTVSSITFNGVSLTQVAGAALRNSVNNAYVDSWRLLAPTTTTADVVITLSGALATGERLMAGCFEVHGVDQTTPIDSVTTAEWGAGTAADITVTTQVNDSLVMSAITTGLPASMIVGANQSEQYDLDASTQNPSIKCSTEPQATAGATDMTHTISATRRGPINGFAIRPAAVDPEGSLLGGKLLRGGLLMHGVLER